MSEELKPCPFCGSAKIDPKGWCSETNSGPECDNCGATAESVGEWNTRHTAEQSGWISVEDRMPDRGSQFVVYVNDIVDAWVDAVYFSHVDRRWKMWLNYSKDYPLLVTHWMPLPSPPQASEVSG